MHKFTAVLLLFGLLFSCGPAKKPLQEAYKHHIIPMPNKATFGKFLLPLDDGIQVLCVEQSQEMTELGEFIQSGLEMVGIAVSDKNEAKKAINLKLILDEKIEKAEAYVLQIDGKGASIRAKNSAGIFYGYQTLLQLIENKSLPYCSIEDAPQFVYRGMHLDVSRHFFPVDFVKKYIDLIARYKMNRFHWHLTDDQGWRIEIKKYPKLQEVAAFRNETLIGHYNDSPQRFDGKRYGGYYTQQEVREVVRYAAARFVEVIPEIEMPGHAQAALSAYPELGCGAKSITAATKWGVFEEVFCPNEQTFEFLENVLTEVFALFPSKYVHIGGDECPKARWEKSDFCQNLMRKEGLKDEHELQSYFIRRMGNFIEKNGKKLIGWDEILEGGLAENATVMSWRGTDGGIAAAKAGHDVIMTPTSHCYFDYYQSDHPKEPLAIGGLLPVEKVYAYNPIPEELKPEEARFILGTQGNVWTEYLPLPENVEYMILPRMPAMAEVAWTRPELKNIDDFMRRVQAHFPIWEAAGHRFANKTRDVHSHLKAGEGKGVSLELSAFDKTNPIEYQLNGGQKQRYSQPILLTDSATITASIQATGGNQGQSATVIFRPHKAAGKKINLKNMPASKYSGAGIGSPFNGVFGSSERYGDAEWLGFEGKDFVADLDFGEKTEVSQAIFRFFNGPGQWIYPPRKIEIYQGLGEKRQKIAETMDIRGTDMVVTIKLAFPPTTVEHLQIHISNFGNIPAGAQGAGYPAWLFVDEVQVF